MTARSIAGTPTISQAIDELIEASRLGLNHKKEEVEVTFEMLKCIARPALSQFEQEMRHECAVALLAARTRRKKGTKRNRKYYPLARSEREALRAKYMEDASRMAARISSHAGDRWHPYGVYTLRLCSAVGYDTQLTFRVALGHAAWTSAKVREFKFTAKQFWAQYQKAE